MRAGKHQGPRAMPPMEPGCCKMGAPCPRPHTRSLPPRRELGGHLHPAGSPFPQPAPRRGTLAAKETMADARPALSCLQGPPSRC